MSKQLDQITKSESNPFREDLEGILCDSLVEILDGKIRNSLASLDLLLPVNEGLQFSIRDNIAPQKFIGILAGKFLSNFSLRNNSELPSLWPTITIIARCRSLPSPWSNVKKSRWREIPSYYDWVWSWRHLSYSWSFIVGDNGFSMQAWIYGWVSDGISYK